MKKNHDNKRGLAVFLMLALTLLLTSAFALEKAPKITDTSGTWSSNSVFRSISSIGQSTPPGRSQSNAYRNNSGFLNSFLMHPLLDTDANGIPDENDPDNDGDALSDADELSGNSFSPTTPTSPNQRDTDSDGVTDANEAATGTNPNDNSSLLKIISIKWRADGSAVITWQSRSNYTYDILMAKTVSGLSSNAVVVGSATGTSAPPPWFESTTSTTNHPPAYHKYFYQIKISN